MHNINKLKGQVVSVTTDGFITDIRDLEKKLLKEGVESTIFKSFKSMRLELSGDDTGLEVKHEGVGIISWTTRGQFSKGSGIKATTGFQSRFYKSNELERIFLDVLSGEWKSLEYVQHRLRSAKDIYNEGGHVTMEKKDQNYRLKFDNRRKVIVPEKYKDQVDMSELILDSEPVYDREECENLRKIAKVHRVNLYNKQTSVLSGNKYKDNTDLAVRNFLKGVLSKPPKYNIREDEFGGYDELIRFIKNYDGNLKVSKSSLSNLKNRRNIIKLVSRTKESVKFVEYVKLRIKDFNEEEFFEG